MLTRSTLSGTLLQVHPCREERGVAEPYQHPIDHLFLLPPFGGIDFGIPCGQPGVVLGLNHHSPAALGEQPVVLFDSRCAKGAHFDKGTLQLLEGSLPDAVIGLVNRQPGRAQQLPEIGRRDRREFPFERQPLAFSDSLGTPLVQEVS